MKFLIDTFLLIVIFSVLAGLGLHWGSIELWLILLSVLGLQTNERNAKIVKSQQDKKENI